MRTGRSFLFSLISSILLLPSILPAADMNDVAYEDRIHLSAGTIWNPYGDGDCLIFPYYDVRTIDGKMQVSRVDVENFGEYGVAAKLRFRDWARGKEIFSKDIWIPSKGVWSARVEINGDGTNAVITGPGNVISRSDANTFYFTNPLLGGAPFSTKNVRKGLGESTLYGFIEVIGEEKTAPDATAGKTKRLSSVERDCPNTLRGNLSITRVEDGVTMAYDGVAIGNFSRGQGSLFRSPGSPYPRLDTCEDTLDQLEFQLSKWEIFGPFSVTPSSQGKTSFIITLPSRFFHYSNGRRIDQINNPFESPAENQGETLKTSLSQGGVPLPEDSEITLPYIVNIIGLYQNSSGPPTGIDNLALSTFSYDSGEAKVSSDNLAQRTLIQDYEYFREMFTSYRGLPTIGLILREYQSQGVPQATIDPADFSAVWESSSIESVLFPTFINGPKYGVNNTSYTFTTGGASSTIGHPIQYQIDWGDGTGITDADWLPVGVTSATHQWAQGGIYALRSRARCALDTTIVSKWSSDFILVIEAVSAPTILKGPVFGVPNTSYTYTTGGSVATTGHPVQYMFDWGDNTDSNWLPVGTTSASKAWPVGIDTGYNVRSKARCAVDTDVVSDWTPNLVVKIESISVPSVPTGPSQGIPGVSYNFMTGGAVSSISDPIEYQFDWGDNTLSPWLSSPAASKTWAVGVAGGYQVKARARCSLHTSIVSDWSPFLLVMIEFISAPTTPAQQATGPGRATFTYSSSGARSNLGDPVQYFFDFGDGTNSGWLPVGVTSVQKTWTVLGQIAVKVKARCATHTSVESVWSPDFTFVITETISAPAAPSGVTIGLPNVSYTFTTGGSVASTGHPVQYFFDWGDGTDSNWLPVGVTFAQKSWPAGTQAGYSVRAKARCSLDPTTESAWSPVTAVRIEVISTPTVPVGPSTAQPGVTYTFTTGGAISNLADSIEYQFDWGDSTFSPWQSLPTATKAWTVLNNGYQVRARARCAIHTDIVSAWSAPLLVNVTGAETVSSPLIPSGPIAGQPNTVCTFTTGGSTSNLGHTVQYKIDWGDNTDSNWLAVGVTSAQKSWPVGGAYKVRAKARCSLDPTIESAWSTTVTVNIESVSTPVVPAGPTTALVGASYTFTTGGASSNIGDPVEYQFDWGDGTLSSWQSSAIATKAWSVLNAAGYQVRVRARCATHTDNLSAWSASLIVAVVNGETVSSPTIPSGPVTGQPNTLYTYTVGGATSNLGHAVQYKIDWGDNTDSNWLAVGATSAQRAWPVGIQGGYKVRAKARCALDPTIESAWSQAITVNIELISTPTIPVGPATALLGALYTYTTGGALSSVGHSVQYKFDWGDGTDSNWLPAGITSAQRSWPVGGAYRVRAKARCSLDTTIESAWSTTVTVNIELISVPTVPVGPITAQPGVSYSFTTGGASSSTGDAVEYQFDWGDSTFSPWQPSPTATKAWTVLNATGYQVRVRARCALHTDNLSAWSASLIVSVVNGEAVSSPLIPSGPVTGQPNTLYTYTTGGATSNFGHAVQYKIDWGDGTDSGWLPVGVLSAQKSWLPGPSPSVGGYQVRAKARCALDPTIESAWSSVVAVNIEYISAPSSVVGPNQALLGVNYTFTAGGVTSSLGDPVEFQFDWGDSTFSPWQSLPTAAKAWTVLNATGYQVRARARCAVHTNNISAWSAPLPVNVVNAETVSSPLIPSGPVTGQPNTFYIYTTGGSTSNLGHSVQYLFDWGDGTDSNWLPVGVTSAQKSWPPGPPPTQGGYRVRAKARCFLDPTIESAWSQIVAINIEYVSQPTTPTGPATVLLGTNYSFTTGAASSSIGDPVEYQFDWGDGSFSPWQSLPTATKTWTAFNSNGYQVRTRARCALHTGNVSAWSASFTVLITNAETVSTPLVPSGQVVGLPNTLYTYSTGGSVSNTGHPVQYKFDWGDGTDSNWLPVGTTTAQKQWPQLFWANGSPNGYSVTVTARCAIDLSVISSSSQPLTVKIETIMPPSRPVGPGAGVPATGYTFMTGSAVSNIGDTLEYQFDWGDGTFSSWQSSTTASKTWTAGSATAYLVRARARCASHPWIMSDWSSTLSVFIEFVTAPALPSQQPAGTLVPGTTAAYLATGASSSTGDPVQYFFDWGDGTSSGWLPTGVTTAQKTWFVPGNFNVRVKARCSVHTNIESAWSPTLAVGVETITSPDIPLGPTTVQVNVQNTYTVGGALSILGHTVQYYVDWGDNTNSGWVAGPTVTKAWTAIGSYVISVRARCSTDPLIFSGWSFLAVDVTP